MAYDTALADRIREYLAGFTQLNIEEKKMFRGLCFMVNGKMCINVSDENLMCRIDPGVHGKVTGKAGYQPMIMKGKELKGYCYVQPIGFKTNKDFAYWIDLYLEFNAKAKASGKKKRRVAS